LKAAMPQSNEVGWWETMRQRRPLVTVDVATAITVAVFMVDQFTHLKGAVAVLYIAVPLILATACSPAIVVAAGVGCGVLTTISFLMQHLRDGDEGAYSRFGVSIAALAVATFLALRQKRGAAELERSQYKFRAMFDQAGFPAWESDWSQLRQYVLAASSSRTEDLESWLSRHPQVVREAAFLSLVRSVNQATINLFEASGADELAGTSITGAIGGFTAGAEAGFGRLIAGLLDGKEVVEAEMPARTLKGRAIEFSLRAARLEDDEPWSRVLFMAFDETERKEARAQLEQASADLAHAARVSMLGQLTASIAHEVCQPLAAIVAYGNSGKRWLNHEQPDLREAEESLDRIIANGSRAADVIERMRRLVRKAPATMESLDVPKLVDETIALVAHDARVSSVVIQREENRRIPRAWADRVQVQQVLANLLLNGVQAMRLVEGRDRRLTIKLGSDEHGMIAIAVRDTGMGLEDPAQVFEPFFTTKGDGMGMGLSISRSIVEAHGGSIHGRNNSDFGATFCFLLPSEQATFAADANSPSGSQQTRR
jgi:C4-dicarboxylate-specific signal transduction histidine kinase